MKRKKILLTLIPGLCFFAIGYGQQSAIDSLTLKEAIRLTLTNQPLLQQALESVNAAQAKIKAQKSLYYPRLEGSLTYNRIGPVPSIDFGGFNFELADANNYDAHLTASQLVYDFGQRDALLDLVKSYKLSAGDKIDLIKNNLTYQTIRSFYTILFLQRSIDVETEQINTLLKHRDLSQMKVESGSATDFDVLTTQVKVAEARNRKIDIENILKKEEINLRSLTGFSSDQTLNLAGKFKADTSAISLDSLINKALQHRPEMKLATDAEKSAKASKQVAALTDRPVLSVLASYGFKNGYQPDLHEIRQNWVAGVKASVPIFNGHLKAAKIEESEAGLNAASAHKRDLERAINKEIQQAAADFEASKLKLRTSRVQVDQAAQAVARAEVKYRDGVITNLDLIDAETSLAQARILYLQVVYRSMLSYYNLKKAVGDVVE